MRFPSAIDTALVQFDGDELDSNERMRVVCEKAAGLLSMVARRERQFQAALRSAGPLTAEQEQILSIWADVTESVEYAALEIAPAGNVDFPC